MGTQAIYNYRRVSDDLITGGQPTEEQLRSVAEEGFRTVINLATLDAPSVLKDEGRLVRSLGMDYHHIPVVWDQPTESDFDAFDRLLQACPAGKTLIHCAANYRVTAFYSLYALKHLGWTEAQAGEFRASIWKGSDYPAWEEFIGRMTELIVRRASAMVAESRQEM